MNKKSKKAKLDLALKKGWRLLNTRHKNPRLSAEEILLWQDRMRMLMFEVWKQNPSLRTRYLKLKEL